MNNLSVGEDGSRTRVLRRVLLDASLPITSSIFPELVFRDLLTDFDMALIPSESAPPTKPAITGREDCSAARSNKLAHDAAGAAQTRGHFVAWFRQALSRGISTTLSRGHQTSKINRQFKQNDEPRRNPALAALVNFGLKTRFVA